MLFNLLSAFSDVFTIVASGIAIYLFIFKRDEIRSVFKVLLNYSSQIALSELFAKLDRLNDLNADEPTHSNEVINILNEIVGQLRGNVKLRMYCSEILLKLENLTEKSKKISEPRKRSIVSELREKLRHVSIQELDDLIGGKNE